MENEEEDIDMLVCMRVAGFGRPVYGSVRGECRECKSPVWISVSGQKALRERDDLIPYCLECATVEMEKSGEEEIEASIVPGAIDELKRHFSKIEEN